MVYICYVFYSCDIKFAYLILIKYIVNLIYIKSIERETATTFRDFVFWPQEFKLKDKVSLVFLWYSSLSF